MAKNKRASFRKKRGDTLIETIEKKYNTDFGVRSDMKLETYLKKMGVPSLGKIIRASQKK